MVGWASARLAGLALSEAIELRIHFPQIWFETSDFSRRRFSLDAVLERGGDLLRDGGSIITHSSSEQGWNTTVKKLSEAWPYWRTLAIEELPIQGDFYKDFVEIWLAAGSALLKNGTEIYHEFRIIEAAHAPFNLEEPIGDRLLNLKV